METIQQDLSPAALSTAVKANLNAFFRLFGRSQNVEYEDSDGLARWHTGIGHPWFNGVLSARPPAENEETTIDETLSFFRSRHVDGLTWWLEPDLSAEDWGRHLLPRGFRYDVSTPGMAVDLQKLESSLMPAGLEIEPVEDLPALRRWTNVFMLGYGVPEAWENDYLELMASLGFDLPVRSYLGLLAGRLVAASTMFIGAGVAGIYNVATLPEARGKGIGSALTVAPLLEARRMGYRIGVLQSSEMGYGVYLRLGFKKFCNIDHYYYKSPND